MPVYDDVDLEDMQWDATLLAYVYQCPCGDVFQITPAELAAGDEIARCPSCTLVIRVIYDPDDLPSDASELSLARIRCVAEQHPPL
ncbi:Diphthamide biosynthesis protein 3 [Gracilariopsis chorda]|uniref:Diphthamide biosynthesis protein 3 n=1 Tax=Gracilariopsis chorda TaxID=448386 RepID=A0A2V3ILI1_9FLOR|nr:Diphthamide biosynthesis protein 3 [Gracilariopsis chorda]|eukprot:PXF42919.1 Diphthamide biosynthesis protein 3 [Gracilariopsis chorda]